MGGGHLNSNDNEYKTEISTGTDGKGIVCQSVFVPLLQVVPSTLQFVSLDISGGLCVTQCKWGSVCVTQCVSHP